MRRYKRYVIVLHENMTYFSLSALTSDEQHNTCKNAILILLADIRSLGDAGVLVQVDLHCQP